MELLRANSLRNFNERIHFTEAAQDAQILGREPHNSSPPRWKLYAGSELLEQTKLRLAANESMLLCVPRINRNLSLDFKRQLFMELFNTLQLDLGVLRPLSSIEATFCRVVGARSESFFIRIKDDILIWTFDTASRTTRGLVIPCGAVSEFSPRLEENFILLRQPLGLLWQCFVSGIESTKSLNDHCWRVLQTVEEGTGYGKILRPEHANDPDNYTEWSKEVARVAVELATVKRNYENLCRVYQELARIDRSGQPLFKDQDALLVARGHLDHETVKAQYLSDRMQSQMSALFNLIAREDTKASIELTKTSKRLTEANLAVARAAKNDSGAMKTISIMTMLFLPATFFAALFSMPTLQWDESPVVRNKFWIYWAFTIPTTLLIFLVWTATTYRASWSYPLTPKHSTDRIYNHDGSGRYRFKEKLPSDANIECG